MLREEFVNEIRNEIKSINKVKVIDDRINQTIELKNKIHNNFNEEIDDLFSEINLKEQKINLD